LAMESEHVVSWRLKQLAWRRNLLGTEELFDLLREGQDPALEEEVVEQLLDTETWFFRDETLFRGIHEVILPDLHRIRNGSVFVKFWSPGSGSGQEIYSLILTVRHHFPAMKDWDLRVLGTDVLESRLEKARLGAYTEQEVRRGLPISLLARYFHRRDGLWTVNEDIRTQASFRQSDITEGLGPRVPSFDLVCVRNLLAGIEPGLRAKAMDSAARQVSPGGYLVLGEGEAGLGVEPDLRVFRKLGGGLFKSFAQEW